MQRHRYRTEVDPNNDDSFVVLRAEQPATKCQCPVCQRTRPRYLDDHELNI